MTKNVQNVAIFRHLISPTNFLYKEISNFLRKQLWLENKLNTALFPFINVSVRHYRSTTCTTADMRHATSRVPHSLRLFQKPFRQIF